MFKNDSVLIGKNLIKVSMIRMIKFNLSNYSMKVYAIGLKPFKVKFKGFPAYRDCYCDLLLHLVDVNKVKPNNENKKED